jgi:hypothetical protein
MHSEPAWAGGPVLVRSGPTTGKRGAAAMGRAMRGLVVRARRGLLSSEGEGGVLTQPGYSGAACLESGACLAAEPLGSLLSKGLACCSPGGILSPTESSCGGIPAPSARDYWGAASPVGMPASGRHLFFDAALPLQPWRGGIRTLVVQAHVYVLDVVRGFPHVTASFSSSMKSCLRRDAIRIISQPPTASGSYRI